MSTTERKQREREERENLFLAKAEELVRSDGLLNLQMARLAEACDYATGTLYQHFSSKEDLLVALAEKGALARTEMFRRVENWPANTRDRMFAVAVGDVFFARRNPEHTKLVQYIFTEAVWENASLVRRERILSQCQPIARIVRGIVREACDSGDLEANGLRELELALGPWCLCEGMHSLIHTHGLLESCQVDRPEELLFLHVQILLNGMGWKPLMKPVDPETIGSLVSKIHREAFDETSI